MFQGTPVWETPIWSNTLILYIKKFRSIKVIDLITVFPFGHGHTAKKKQKSKADRREIRFVVYLFVRQRGSVYSS